MTLAGFSPYCREGSRADIKTGTTPDPCPSAGNRHVAAVRHSPVVRPSRRFPMSAVTLLRQNEQVSFRIMARRAVACAMHIEAASTRTEYFDGLLIDDKASRISLRKVFQKVAVDLTEEANRELQQCFGRWAAAPKAPVAAIRLCRLDRRAP